MCSRASAEYWEGRRDSEEEASGGDLDTPVRVHAKS